MKNKTQTRDEIDYFQIALDAVLERLQDAVDTIGSAVETLQDMLSEEEVEEDDD